MKLDKKFENPVCQACIKRQLEKYQDYVDDGGREYKEFGILCKGIPVDYVTDQMRAVLPEETCTQVADILDPATWAENWVKLPDGKPWTARWYQEEMLRCTALRRVTRLGRRCLAGDTQIMTPGGPVAIKDIKVNDEVYAFNTKDNTVSVTNVTDVFDQGKQNVVDLMHHNSRVLACTTDHRWHISTYWGTQMVKRLDEFSRDNPITRRFVDVPMGKKQEPHAYAIGALLGDGCSKERGSKIYLSSENSVVPQAVANILGVKFKKCAANNNTWVLYNQQGRGNADTIFCNHYNNWCRNCYAHEKTVDLSVIKTWNRASCLAFLAGLLDTDGSVVYSGTELQISWGMQAKAVIEAVQYLLLALFQVQATIHEDKRDKYVNGSVWYVNVKNSLFNKRILRSLNPYLHVERKKWKEEYDLLIENNSNPSSYGVKFDLGKQYKTRTYDISIDTPDHLFLTAEGLVSHNSGKTDCIAIHILHYCFTNKDKYVLVIAPYKAHVKEVMDRIRAFVRTNPDLLRSIQRDVGSPFEEIVFRNRSRIRAFSSGTKSGSEGVAVRGQDADRIYLDEADYLDEGDLKAITAILITKPTTELWASSTPTGRRSHFWRWCVKTPTYKEFHHSTMVLPAWKEQEAQIRADYAGKHDDWTHEILADFGEETVGVFQHGHVGEAVENYKYEDMHPKSGWTYITGVDWNSNVGTEIVTVGYNGTNFHVVSAINVPKQGWTQLAGCEAIINVNALWRPAFIYVDEGAGATNIELLRKYGFQMAAQNRGDPAAVLQKIVKAYNFSAKIEARDPLTKKKIKKHAKPFMVENATRFFEEHRLKISAYDRILLDQLANYIIKHRTTAGIPVYGITEEKVGDHRLDALMLALIGFKLEMSLFGKPIISTNLSITPGFVGLMNLNIEPEPPSKQRHIDKEVVKRFRALPESRYSDASDDIFSPTDLPGITMNKEDIPHVRHGFMTDEEEKYELIHKLRRLRQQGRFRRTFPKRSNI